MWMIIWGNCFSPLARSQMQTGPQDPPVVTSLPARSSGTGGGCKFDGPFLYVNSKPAGPQGLLVRISPPSKGRYPEGAPIAVHMLSAIPRVNGSIACLSEERIHRYRLLVSWSAIQEPGWDDPEEWRRPISPRSSAVRLATCPCHCLRPRELPSPPWPVAPGLYRACASV